MERDEFIVTKEGRVQLPVSRIMIALVRAVEDAVPLIETYRSKNVSKYYAEKDLEFSEYTKLERYKNRVRICDIVLPIAKQFLKDCGKFEPAPETDNADTIV